jgi:iron complex transport system substrate-binding protein
MKHPVLVCLLIIMLLSGSCIGRKDSRFSSVPGTGKNNSQTVRAERFTLLKNDSCTVVTIINPWQGAEGINQTYYLVSRESNLALNVDPGSVIYVPVRRIICMSTTHLAMIAALGETDAIVGVSGSGYVYNKTISDRINEGYIKDVGYEAGMNSELIIKSAPDLVMIYGVGSESAGYAGKIKELGIKVMYNADYLETDPLGKAEWIKLFGALFCREHIADSIFSSVSESYQKVKSYVSSNSYSRPFVMLGLPFKDSWFISPGNSYISRIISDSGGEYLWHDTESSVSMPLSLETVFLKSMKADFWLNTGSARTKEEIVSFDARLRDIPCFRQGNLFNNNKRVTLSGGNDYWEGGTLYPHLILKDIASILHPDLFKGHELFYYGKIE